MKKKAKSTDEAASAPVAKKATTQKVATKTAKKQAAAALPKVPKPPKESQESPPLPAAKKVAKKAAKKATAKSVKAVAVPVVVADPDTIAAAAFLNWCQRRDLGLPDDALADWIQAEQQLGLRSA